MKKKCSQFSSEGGERRCSPYGWRQTVPFRCRCGPIATVAWSVCLWDIYDSWALQTRCKLNEWTDELNNRTALRHDAFDNTEERWRHNTGKIISLVYLLASAAPLGAISNLPNFWVIVSPYLRAASEWCWESDKSPPWTHRQNYINTR